MICWKLSDKNCTNLDRLQLNIIRCVFHWRKKDHWRRDCVWIQNQKSNKNYQFNESATNNDRCVKKMQLIISVLDYLWFNRHKRLRKYIDALIELKRWINKKVINEIHEMYEIENFSKNTSRNSRRLHFRRFYDLSHIIRNVHLVSTNQKFTKYYVNNFIN